MDLSLIVLTDRKMAARPLLDVVKSALDGGARTFLLREKDLPRAERLAIAEAMRQLGCDVIAAGPDPLGGDAVHLSAHDPVSSARLTGRSCHDKAEVMASKEDYVTLSPIFLTTSKPGYGPALGLAAISDTVHALAAPASRLQAIIAPGAPGGRDCVSRPRAIAVPGGDGVPGREARGEALGAAKKIVALGGIDSAARAQACREAGAAGVAVMGAVMRAQDPATVVKGLLP